ncbi:outer membrane lipoprotein-sorting protein, partial [Candidatus Bipolaricaulota bacterium]|nr:outer membrane lipoprotein-sorting protein [Candidatus Bipolaricaulota bacterium]
GTIFLMHDAQEEGADNRLWLFLPFLGIPKELVNDDDRGGSFAGSSLSYEDLGDQDRRDDYAAVLLGEEEVTIGDLTRTAYKIESTAKPEADVDELRTILWIDKEFLIMLKMESYNDLGNLSSTMEVQELAEFEGKLTASVMLATDVSAGSSTTVTISGRRRPDAEIADAVFSPENLTAFKPVDWGF